MNVSVIIVNYNTKELTRNCLRSVFEQTKDIAFEVIVSDNGSTDGSVEMIRKEFPQVTLIENGENLGFGKANNRAAQIACGEYLLLLNSDTLFLNNALKCFYDTAKKEAEKVAFGSWLFYADGDVANSYGEFTKPFLFLLKKNIYDFYPAILKKRLEKIKANRRQNLDERFVDFIIGADLFIAKNDFDGVGGFDEQFFMYFEDDDLCRRLLQNGVRCKIIASPRIVHLESKSLSVKIKRILLQDESFFCYVRKWNGRLGSVLFSFAFVFLYFLRLLSPALTWTEKVEMMKTNLQISFRLYKSSKNNKDE